LFFLPFSTICDGVRFAFTASDSTTKAAAAHGERPGGAAPIAVEVGAPPRRLTLRLRASKERQGEAAMTCRVDRFLTEEGTAVLRVTGRITGEDVDVLRAALEQESRAIAIDLSDVSLIDREVVKVLAVTEGNGIALRNCPAYIREWIDRESANGVD
jgi:hypothetical protein